MGPINRNGQAQFSTTEQSALRISMRAHGWASLWLLMATAACFSRLVQHPADLLVGPHGNGQSDLTRHVLAFRTLNPLALSRTGELPLWNPWSMAGVPLYGNPQAGLFYPLNWLYFFVPDTWCANWQVFIHHWWAGLGTYLLALRFGLGWFPSLGAGIFFLGAPYMMAQTCEGHVSQVCLMSWAPWLWLCYEQIRSGKRGGTPAAALVMSLAFACGHVQELYYLVLALSLFAIWDGVCSTRDASWTSRLRIPCCWFAAGGLTVGMVAVELLPIRLYLQQAVRASGISVAQASHGSPEARSLWQLLDPLAYGGPQNSLMPDSYSWGTYWESIFYFGVGTSLLAIWGGVSGRRRYPTGRLIALALVTLLFSFGDKTPLFPLLHSSVPGIGMFRAPMRALFHASLAISLLAGMGLDQVLATAKAGVKDSHRRFLILWGGMSLLSGLGLVLAIGKIGPFRAVDPAHWPQIHWDRTFGYLFGVCILLFMSVRYIEKHQRYLAICLLVCLVDLAWHGRMITQTVPLDVWRTTNPIVSKVEQDIGLNRLFASQRLVSDREAWKHGIFKIQAYEPVPIKLWSELITAMYPQEDPARILTGFQETPLSQFNKSLLDLLSVKYAAVSGQNVQSGPGWKQIEQGFLPLETGFRGGKRYRSSYTLFQNQSALPRAYVVYQARRCNDRESLLSALKTFDPRAEVLVDASFPNSSETKSQSELTEVEVIRYSPSRIELRVPALNQGPEETAFLCLSDLYYPGWKATVDGKDAEIYPGNLAFRAIPLTGNQPCQVRLTYQPPGSISGAAISFASWTIWLGVMGYQLRRKSDHKLSNHNSKGQLDE